MQVTHFEKQPIPLSTLLRTTTAQIHDQIEGLTFIDDLLEGKITDHTYLLYLQSLFRIYFNLEKSLEAHRENPLVAPVFFKELFRTKNLKEDLKHWSSDTSFGDLLPPELEAVVNRYVSRIEELSLRSPTLLAAHAYVRFLGDLSGGRVMKTSLEKIWGKSKSLSFFEYEDLNLNLLKGQFRAGLDQIGVTCADQLREIGAEAVLAFELNAGVFKALENVQSHH